MAAATAAMLGDQPVASRALTTAETLVAHLDGWPVAPMAALTVACLVGKMVGSTAGSLAGTTADR